MAVTQADFNRIWASTSPLTPYNFSNTNYLQGWNFVGSTPPARQMWDKYMNLADQKMQYLYNNYLPLAGGILSGYLQFSELDSRIISSRAARDGAVSIYGGGSYATGSYAAFYGINHDSNAGRFIIRAVTNGSKYKELQGKPDGTLTWDGNNILTAANYNSYALPLSGGTMSGAITTTANPSLKVKNNDSYLVLCGASSYEHGAHMLLNGKNRPYNEGTFGIVANDGSGDRVMLIGKPDGTLTWDGQPLLPIGVVQAFAGSTIPTGWLLCDGSAVSRTTYANLYACIGTTYGSGDGSTTFNLPNLVDKFVEGSATAGTVKSAGLPNITGSIGGGTGAGGSAGSGSGVGFLRDTMIDGCFQPNTYGYGNESGSGGGTVPSGYPVLTANLDASRSSAIYGKSTTVQPPALTMRYIIKY